MRIEKTAELEKYLPIPNVFWKLGAGAVVKLALGLLIWRFLGDWLSGSLLRAIVFGLSFAAVYVTFWSALVLKNNNPFSWLKEFWRRNIRGYTLDCYLDDNGAIAYGIEEPDQMFYREVLFPTLFLPLGGWFLRWRQKQTRDGCPPGWSACFAGIECGQTMVQLTDCRGESLILSARVALDVLWEVALSGSASDGAWQSVLRLLILEKGIYKKEVDEAWQRIDVLDRKAVQSKQTIISLEWYVGWLRKALTCVNKDCECSERKPDSSI